MSADIPECSPVVLQVRKPVGPPRADFSVNWFDGLPYRTHTFNATSMMFPLAESFFIEAIRAVSGNNRIASEVVEDFVAQESAHAKQHAAFNRILDKRFGLPNCVDARMKRQLSFVRSRGIINALAFTVCTEHVAAIYSEMVLDGYLNFSTAEETPYKLLSWHAAEEIEHKAVAFDIYVEAGGGYWRRCTWFAVLLVLFFSNVMAQTLSNLKKSEQLWCFLTWLDAFRFSFGRQGVAWRIALGVFEFLRPGFHPWKRNNYHLVQQWHIQQRSSFDIVLRSPKHAEEVTP